MTDFYSKDSIKAIDELKEELYARLAAVREKQEDSSGLSKLQYLTEWFNGFTKAASEEERFLKTVLDKLERS